MVMDASRKNSTGDNTNMGMYATMIWKACPWTDGSWQTVITVEQHARKHLRQAHHLMTSHGFAGAGAAAGAPSGGKSS